MLTLNDGRSELWQWDTSRKLAVDSDCSQVHFSNKVFGRSIDVDVLDGVAIVPDILLQTDRELTAWAFVGTAENGYTKISKVFKVNKRNKPADYVFTPPEQTSLEEIKEKLDYLESIQDPDAIKNAVEDYLEKNPVESPVQSVNGKTGKVDLTAEDVGAISQDKLQEATNEALAQAKASGAFNGAPGNDYVLTEEDKAEIAEMAADLVDVPDSGGNADLTGYATEEYVQEYAQPKGDYLERSDKSEIVEEVLEQIPEGSGGAAIIDVVELPTENIREDVFYRVVKGSVLVGKLSFPTYVVHCVETLPETGLPATNDGQTEANVYITLSDYEAYGYIDAMLSQALGIPTGWYPAAILLNSLGYEYAGVITSWEETNNDSKLRVLLNYITYSHISGSWTSYEKVGISGSYNSVTFNDPENKGNDYSVATGINTWADGIAAFTMGEGTKAYGTCTLAIGSYNNSPISPTASRGRYAFVVGNGRDNNDRSNAHTLDWDGNAWFAGSVEGTALILKSPSGKRFKITVDDSGNLSATATTE